MKIDAVDPQAAADNHPPTPGDIPTKFLNRGPAAEGGHMSYGAFMCF